MASKPIRFFKDDDFEFVFLGVLGTTYYRLADVGEVLAIAERVKNGDAESGFQAFVAYGERALEYATRAESKGHRISARDALLRASTYLASSTYFLDASKDPSRFQPTWERHRDAWDRAMTLLTPPAEPVQIPYEGTTLPGYFLRADNSSTPRPVLIMNNGSDGSVSLMWAQGAAAALERGYHVLLFDGPGQNAALWRQHLYFRPDWERVVTPVVDFLVERPDVDAARIAIVGVSQGGFWVPRAVAFEPRIAAAVADPGVTDVSTSWFGHLPKSMRTMLEDGKEIQFDRWMAFTEKLAPSIRATLTFRSRPYGTSTLHETFKATEQYRLDPATIARIRTPLLITDPEGEQFWPGQSQALYDQLHGPKTLLKFTADQGADWHCEPKAVGLRAQQILDWIDETLDAR